MTHRVKRIIEFYVSVLIAIMHSMPDVIHFYLSMLF